MKIQKKIALWISGTAFLSTIIFSSFIFFELMEEHFKSIDNEIQYMAVSLVEHMEDLGKGPYDFSYLPYLSSKLNKYWIKVTNSQGKILYQSALVKYIDIPSFSNKTSYMLEKVIPRSQVQLGQDSQDGVLFRVSVIKTFLTGLPIEVRIAKPIESLEEKLLNLIRRIAISLSLGTLLIIVLSYKLAGKILNPIVSITRMSKEISEKSLYKRIPLSRNKDELYDLSLALNKMFDSLQYSFKQQKEFIGNASHELKSPITLLMLAQEEMLMNENLPSSASNALNKQLDTTRRMSHLVRNLLDLSRLEHQETLDKKPVDMATLVGKVLNDYTELFKAKKIRIQNKLSGELIIQGDKEKLFRLLINLIDNSIRYNFEKDGIVIVEGKKINKGVRLEVSNTAKPIPEDDIDQIFEQFYRVEKSRSTSHGGSGLGLAIGKKIVELHGGTIVIINEPGSFVKVSVFFS